MRRTARFVLNATIALFLVSVSTLIVQLISLAPLPLGGRVTGLHIDSVFIPGQAFRCDRLGQDDRCQVSLFDRPLELTITVPKDSTQVTKCQLSYAGQTANCTGEFHVLISGGWRPTIYTQSTLGLSVEQQAKLKEKYPQKNFLFDMGENRLVNWGMGIAIAASVLTFLFGWLNYSRGILFFGIGVLVFVVSFLIAMAMLLALGYVD